MDEIKIGIRELAEALYSSGDLSNEYFFNSDFDGHEIQRRYQESLEFENESEVYVKYYNKYDNFEITLTGFIDGINHVNNEIIIEEIKSTKVSLDEIDENYHLEHFNQLKLYMAIYCFDNLVDSVKGKLTYINANSMETKAFEYSFNAEELLNYLENTILKYYEIYLFFKKHNLKNMESISKLSFPYEDFRQGQKDLMKAVVHTVKNKKILYSNAPTGIGKTVSTLYPSVKTINKFNQKVFYLTNKDLIKQEPIKLMSNFSNITTLEISSKEKLCFNNCSICETEKCPFAKRFFEKLYPAVMDIISTYNIITKKEIIEFARKYEICPFEFSLYVSHYAYVIVCDYNYVFDPHCRLIRYFDDDTYEITALVDEAHNLVKRSKDMYSSEINYSSLLLLSKYLKSKTRRISKAIEKFCDDSLMKYEFDNDRYVSSIMDEKLIKCLENITDAASRVFEKHKKFKNRELALKIYFDIKKFLKINDYYNDENYKYLVYKSDDDFKFKIMCLNASKEIYATSSILRGLVLFSATLSPIDYYKKFLTGGFGEHLILPSPFNKNNLGLYFVDNLFTNYNNRKNTIAKIITTIDIMTSAKEGNYIVFFPSFDYMQMVLNEIKEAQYTIIRQNKDMNFNEREEVMKLFDDSSSTKVGFFVMGGIFSEGIDYIGDKLIGVIVVGVGLPKIDYENDLLKEYCESNYGEGFKYAYTYPGYNKVLQAIGRVIRSNDDRGIAIVMDYRITSEEYLNMLPSQYYNYIICNSSYNLSNEIIRFWKNKKGLN